MKDCLFCKIVDGTAPCYKIYEDKDTLAFLDISGDVYGHTLVVPKGHCTNILDAEPKTLQAVMLTAQKIAKHFVQNCGVDGVNIVVNNNPAAEQKIMHLHVHILPRVKDANFESIYADLPCSNFDFEHMQAKFGIK